MTPDERKLRDEIERKHKELEQLKDDLRMMVEERNRRARMKASPFCVDMSVFEDDGK